MRQATSFPTAAESTAASARPRRVFVVGATGTIGRATVRALVARGHDVTCFVRARGERRRGEAPPPERTASSLAPLIAGALLRVGDVTDPASLARDGFCGEPFDVVVSCMASRTGEPRDAWAVDHAAHIHLLQAARTAGVEHMVLLSAICVQKPKLAFQHAKLAFEKALAESGLTYSIVRPTAYFKSLSGQVERVRKGKPFLVFGDGTLTACKPISDDDLAEYMVGCLDDPERQNCVLPIGGPGDALTLREQGALLCATLGRPARFSHVPVGLLDTVASVFSVLGRVIPPLASKAELAKIGRYYATESMLVWDAEAGRYDAEATPSFGRMTLAEHYARLARGETGDDRGDHAVF